MTYVVVVPDLIRDEIDGRGLSPDAQDKLYELLAEELTNGPDRCLRLPAPAPTFVHVIDFQEPGLAGIHHRCTFWLTYGPLDFALYVQQFDHRQVECWDPDVEDPFRQDD